jgi:hypothetical protein
LAAFRVPLIDNTVAVVVEAVAYLGGGLNVLNALQRSAQTGQRSRIADAGLTRAARNAPTRIPLIHDAVAVVVQAVAYFL